jgi:DNA gyrase subunit A
MKLPLPRPDLSALDPQVRAYIEALEAALAEQAPASSPSRSRPAPSSEPEPETPEYHEPPTTFQVITATATGSGKRTARHHYARQRRSGMGVFDLDTPEADPPAMLAVADLGQTLLALTTAGRAFRLPVASLVEAPQRARGASFSAKFNLEDGERLAALLPVQAEGYLAVLSQSGFVRLLRHHVFGEYMKPGASLLDPRQAGPLVAACWSDGSSDLFVATRQARAIRFAEKLVPPPGVQAIRLEPGDQALAIASVRDRETVFLLGTDGKGILRAMENFLANKAPGAGGKQALNATELTAARAVQPGEDIFIITRLSKVIRFSAAEVPVKDGVVQGVVCISLRADQPLAVTSCSV